MAVKQANFLATLFLCITGMSLFACSNSQSLNTDGEEFFAAESPLNDMILFLSNGTRFPLGPKTSVAFTYDFFIGEHEVTCGEYNALAGETFTKVDCKNDSLPVTNVSFFDAVLFSNAYSKAHMADTVYTYTAAVYDGENHCVLLEGFDFHPDVAGYRLPTEAEWVSVASQSWNPANSWNLGNSKNSAHKVCSIPQKWEGRPCDMAGNAMEWVNDWYTNLPDTTLANFVGAPDGGTHGKRIVKGGSFLHEAAAMNAYSRGDVYTVTSASRTWYIGFRLGYGSIPDPVWMNANGSAQQKKINVLASTSIVSPIVGSHRAKLAFRNDATGNIAYIDYGVGNQGIIEIADTIDAYHPEISPDGKKVAFCTGLEGVAGKSALYVRDLNPQGTNLVKLDVESAAIPRWRVRAKGDTSIIYVTSAANNKIESDFSKSSTWEVLFSKGRFHTPQKLFDGAYHGGLSRDKQLAVTSARLLRTRMRNRDTVWYNGEQACNASLSKDLTKRTLFLDFGGSTGKKFTGVDYGTHQMLLVADSTGELVQGIPSPKGYSFDHTEWINSIKNRNSEKLAVASLTDADGAHRKLAIVNLHDSSITNLAEGEELWHPSLWVKVNESDSSNNELNLDSAGAYYSIDQSTHYLAYKMRIFWRDHQSVEIVGLGNSRMQAGFYASKLEHALNMATVPCDIFMSHYIFKNYLLTQAPNLKYLLVSLDFDLWDQKEGNSFKDNFGSAPGFAYDANHDFWQKGLYDGFYEAVQNSIVDVDANMELTEQLNGFGFISVENASGWGKPEVLNGMWELKSDMPQKNYERFLDILKMAKEHNIYVIGVIFPMNPRYASTKYYGRHGMNRYSAENFIERIKKLDNDEKYFVLMDENKMGKHDYDDSMASDSDHLNEKGAEQLINRIKAVLEKISK